MCRRVESDDGRRRAALRERALLVRSVAVLGANGQVGTEVCLFLSVLEDTRVFPIVRSELGAAYLARCGLECRIGSTATAKETESLLAGTDLVVDLTLPRGLPSQVLDATRGVVANSIRYAPEGAAFVYGSSTMAFGMPADAKAYRNHLVARTAYASQKRYAERLARRLGRAHRRSVFGLRLGQVHGELQRTSRGMLLKLAASQLPVRLRRGSETASDTVFCSTIALALRNIAHGLEAPGTYTLLESPEWSWREVYEFYSRASGGHLRFAPDLPSEAPRRGAVRSALDSLTATSARFASGYKDLLNAQLLPILSRLPRLEQVDLRLRGPYLIRKAAAEIRSREAVLAPEYVDGPVPGRRLRNLGDSRSATEAASRRVRSLLDERFGPESHNFISD
jgi:nucleoside-diphosphate-sugar epimerase